jgi:CrcB protein
VRTVVGVGVMGAVGALARYGIGGFLAQRFPSSFPWETLMINVTGSFLLGLLFAVLERSTVSAAARTSLTIGLLGAYTTFSTFSLETVRLIQEGSLGLAALNVATSVALGLSAVWTGLSLGRSR